MLRWSLRRLKRYQVSGESMAPTLAGGDCVLADPSGVIAAGAVVLARHPYRSDTCIVKRVARVERDGRLFLCGDNPAESTDSAHFGAVSPERIIGVVVARMPA